MGTLKRALRLFVEKRDFRYLMGSQFLAQAGDGLVQAALATAIVFGGQKGFDLEGARSPDEILRIALYIFVPYTVLSPFLGVVIDRWDRRRILFVANGFRAVVMAVVALAGVADVPDAVLFLSFLLTLTSTRVVLATKAAALPAALGGSSLHQANAVSQLGGAMFQLAGAGAALVAKSVIPVEPIVIAGALVYGAGAASALLIGTAGEVRARGTLLEEVARVGADIVAGFKEVARTPKAGASITTYFWLRCLWSFTLVGIGFRARALLAGDDLQVALLTGGAGAIGAGLGFLVAARALDRVRSTAHLVLIAAVTGGAAVAVLGGISGAAALASLTFGLGLGFFLAKISLDTMVQEALGDDFRGRAFSLYDIAYNVAWVLAASIMKVAWSGESQGLLLASAGVVFLVGIGLIGLWFRSAGLLSSATQGAGLRTT
ncbi:MAG TPA: MFS transporter [Actinomycetota bacterium]|nr:MFS transporter [Actinomycetota bacterium]